MSDINDQFVDYQGRPVRLTDERRAHILEHPEMVGQMERIRQTLIDPQAIIVTDADETVEVYHRFYEVTPVTSKYLHVVVKSSELDAFVLTAFYSSRRKRGSAKWQK